MLCLKQLRLKQLSALLALAGIVMFSGCGALHPKQAWKLNRGPAMDEDVFFSVPDPPLPEAGLSAEPQ